ncbi:DUF3095 domain-containing protein [Aureimonas psammosilenae]|uniref:DUF3095 domain-containing protein n=1 Tax=Aureimonas psammosilenae TaxID=2495496 RepID=UPI0012605246|nr:DUF3095 domain-containing protein [Aureimonas psammosilenae]
MPGDFYADLPPVEHFLHLAGIEHYRPVPDDTVLFLGDVVGSTDAIAEGRYKEVNVAAAAIVAAIGNALSPRRVAFSFGGDGAAFILPADLAEAGRSALAGVVRWVGATMDLDLRAASIPVAEIRQAGLDLRLARFAITPDLSYAMFSGGGLAWAEARMKEGRFAIHPADEPPPDLEGLSCRFASMPARNGLILSLIVVPGERDRLPEFSAFVLDLLKLAESRHGEFRPIHEKGLKIRWSLKDFLTETKTAAARRGGRNFASFLRSGAKSAVANAAMRINRPFAGFDPAIYRQDIVRNTDFRKFDDGLRMTLDCSAATADEIEAMLARGKAQGLLRYGTHRQDEAMLTCFVPSPRAKDHVHFIDGAAGGYAFAAQALKSGG